MDNVFNSVEEAVKALKLDRRRKYFELCGDLCFSVSYTAPCSGCSCDCSDGYGCSHGNAGCSECGYTGKRRDGYPVPIFMPDGETIVKIKNMERIKIKNDRNEYYLLEVEKHHLDEALDQINMSGNCEFVNEEIEFKEPFVIDIMSEDNETVIGKLTHERSLIYLGDDLY